MITYPSVLTTIRMQMTPLLMNGVTRPRNLIQCRRGHQNVRRSFGGMPNSCELLRHRSQQLASMSVMLSAAGRLVCATGIVAV
jgi:hypothetical protein